MQQTDLLFFFFFFCYETAGKIGVNPIWVWVSSLMSVVLIQTLRLIKPVYTS